jgi:hypothetical protein
MSVNTNTITTTEFVLSAAREAYSTLKRVNGQRPLAVKAFLDATTDSERDEAIEAWGAGFVRRGLREAAVFFAGKDDEETANAFWTLRDSIEEDEFLNFDGAEVEETDAA